MSSKIHPISYYSYLNKNPQIQHTIKKRQIKYAKKLPINQYRISMQQISIDYTYIPLLIYFYYLLHYFELLILILHEYMLIQMLLSCRAMALMILSKFISLRLLYNILIFSSFLMGADLRILRGCLGIVGLFRGILSG